MFVCLYVCLYVGRWVCMYACKLSCFVIWSSSMRRVSLLHRLVRLRKWFSCYHFRWYAWRSCSSTKASNSGLGLPHSTKVNLTMTTPIRKMRTEIRGPGTARDPRTRCSPLLMSDVCAVNVCRRQRMAYDVGEHLESKFLEAAGCLLPSRCGIGA